MRSFYHTDVAPPRRALQQRLQLPQSLTTHTRRLRDTHEPASGCIEHPLRNGQRPPRRLFLLQSTVEDRFAAFSYRGVDRNVTTEPRMPRISENTELGNVGLVLLACTMPGAGTAHWTDAPRMRCTSRRPAARWRPEIRGRFHLRGCPRSWVHFSLGLSAPNRTARLHSCPNTLAP